MWKLKKYILCVINIIIINGLKERARCRNIKKKLAKDDDVLDDKAEYDEIDSDQSEDIDYDEIDGDYEESETDDDDFVVHEEISLSDKEKKYLDHYSMNNEFLDDEELTTTKSVADQGETWVFNEMEGIPSMEFKYESTEENVDEILHSGYLNVNNDEFYGEIYCDPEGDYSTCNFEDPDGINLFERYEGLEHEVESFLYNVCDEIKGSNAV